MGNSLPLNSRLKDSEDIENSVQIFNSNIQQAGWKASPEHNPKYYKKLTDPILQNKIKRNIRLRKMWQINRVK